MKYNAEIGKIYDTLFFCIEFFNEQAVKDTITNNFSDVSFMEECYNEVKKTVSSLPSILKPLFLYQNQTPTVMTSFFTEYIDYQNETIDTFLSKITSKSDVIYSKILSALFPTVSNAPQSVAPCIAPAAYIEALNSSEYPEDLKLQISLLFGNFDYVISLLVEFFHDIYHSVDALHQRQQSKLTIAREQICSERNLQLYKQLLILDCSNLEVNYYFSISLLNQYITKETIMGRDVGLLLGFKHEESLNQYFDEKNINLRLLLTTIGNDTRLSIIQVLTKHTELTASSLSKALKVPLTTVLRHIEILYGNGVLYISKRDGLQIFYRVNYSLLTKAVNILNHKIGELTNEQTKKNTAEKME